MRFIVIVLICAISVLNFNSCCKKKEDIPSLSFTNLIPKVGDTWVYRLQGIFSTQGKYDTIFIKVANNTIVGDTTFFSIIEVANESSNNALNILGDYLVFKNGIKYRNKLKFFNYWSNFIFTTNMQLGDKLILPNPLSDTAKYIFTNFYPTKIIADNSYNAVSEFTQNTFSMVDTFKVTQYIVKDIGIIYQDADRKVSGTWLKNKIELIKFIRK